MNLLILLAAVPFGRDAVTVDLVVDDTWGEIEIARGGGHVAAVFLQRLDNQLPFKRFDHRVEGCLSFGEQFVSGLFSRPRDSG